MGSDPNQRRTDSAAVDGPNTRREGLGSDPNFQRAPQASAMVFTWRRRASNDVRPAAVWI